jgi:hypothetical protein
MLISQGAVVPEWLGPMPERVRNGVDGATIHAVTGQRRLGSVPHQSIVTIVLRNLERRGGVVTVVSIMQAHPDT